MFFCLLKKTPRFEERLEKKKKKTLSSSLPAASACSISPLLAPSAASTASTSCLACPTSAGALQLPPLPASLYASAAAAIARTSRAICAELSYSALSTFPLTLSSHISWAGATNRP